MQDQIPYRSDSKYWVGRRWKGPYEEYLRTDWWSIVRITVLGMRGRICQQCGWKWGQTTDRLLDVHHLTYERLGDELSTDLRVLCSVCHAAEHGQAPRQIPPVGVTTVGHHLMDVFAKIAAGGVPNRRRR